MRAFAVGSPKRRRYFLTVAPSCLWLIGCTDIPSTLIIFFIFNYHYCLLFESSEDVSWGYFVVVRGKTAINAVCANLSRFFGGNYITRTHHTRVGMECATYALT